MDLLMVVRPVANDFAQHKSVVRPATTGFGRQGEGPQVVEEERQVGDDTQVVGHDDKGNHG